ncbi:DUF1080 domain-containing protein [Arenibacter sp. H213]|uniref:DUF1080 domain-containing protein n=2 Tax=Arenibacter antarcticus TaxID=2040469 RepID=A0ABW5VGH2_9FLAO|nr:DUF1080 domain-containing protein [Arenibacter sp. H213]
MQINFFALALCLLFFACKTPMKTSKEQVEIISLFNGENLDKWTGDSRIWSVENGCIVGRTTDENQIERNTFLIFETPFSDFELRFKYKIIGGNSGVQYRSKVLDEDLFIVGGYQADMEAGTQHSGILYEEKGRGILAKRGEAVVVDEKGQKSVDQFANSESIQENIKSEQWNAYRIVAHGNHLQHFINGHKTIDVIDKEIEKKSDSGIIALQVHKGPNMEVYYKDIMIGKKP